MKRVVYTLMVLLAMTINIHAQTNSLFNPPDNLLGGLDPNSNGVVGSIGGTVDVSALGGATYTIPIQLPDGIHGIQPNLSVVYNSQSGNGLLGWGWELGGVSAITRTGKTLYHDQIVEGVDFHDDRFSLDGQRLMEISGDYGGNGTEYRTEVDGMSKIVSYSEGNLSPSYFKVWFANGTIAYYGNSTDSKVKLQETDNVCFWLLNRVEDRDGNYMTYHYITGGADFRLDKIRYTGNSNAVMGPMFIIQFNYADRSVEAKEKRFVGPNDVNLNKLLNSIEIKKWLGENNSPVICTYDFVYKQRHDAQGSYGRLFYDQLIEIQCKYYDYNQTPAVEYHYNPTVISYGEYPFIFNGNGSQLTDAYKTVIHSIETSYRGAQKFVGDFNGDGLSDFVTVSNEGEWIKLRVFVNQGNDKTDSMPNGIQFELQSEWEYQNETGVGTQRAVNWIYICDFNGDGMDDIIVHLEGKYFLDPLKSEYLDIYKSSVDSVGILETNRVAVLTYSTMKLNEHLTIATGDFMGRSKSDFIVQRPDNVLGQHVPFCYYDYNNNTGRFIERFSDGSSLRTKRLATGDFNGDGKTEILFAGEGYVQLVKIQKDNNLDEYSLTVIDSFNWGDNMVPFVGDFNGDGVSDVLFNGGNNWYVKLFGNPETYGYFTYDVTQILGLISIDESPYYGYNIADRFTEMNYYISIADMNGDGKSDVIGVNEENMFYILYGPVLPEPRTYYGHFAKHDSYPGTLAGVINNGNSSISALCVGNFFGQENQAILDLIVFSMPPLSTYYGVKAITDGMGNRTEFDYGYLVENPHQNVENIYTLNHDAENHARDIYAINLPMKAAKRIISYNRADSISNPNQYMRTCCEYGYGGVLLHRKGKGILGMTTNSIESYTVGSPFHDYVLRENNTNMLGDYCTLTPAFEKTYLKKVENGQLKRITESAFSYDKHVHTQNGKVFMPLLTDRITDHYSIDCQINGVPKFLKREITHNVFENWQNNCYGSQSHYSATTINQNNTNYQNCEFQGDWRVEVFENDLNNWLIQKPSIVDVGKGGFLYEDIYTYDTDKPHQLKHVVRFPQQNYSSVLATRTAFTYDVAGNVLTKTLSGENDNTLVVRKTSFEYGGYRLLHKKREWLDENEGRYYETIYNYDPYFNYLKKETNCRGQETVYSQDPLGINCIEISPNGIVTRTQTGWLSDNSGYYEWSYTVGNAPIKTYYDLKGVIQKVETYGFDDNQLIVKNYYYNAHGQLIEEEDAHVANSLAQTTQYTYDNYNRLRKTVYPNGNVERIIHDANNGFKTSTTLTAGNVVKTTSQQVNAIGLVTTSWDEANNIVEYTYTEEGFLETATVNNDPKTAITIKYDEAGNRNKLFDPDYCGNGNEVLYAYDAYGQLLSQTTPKGNVTQYGYDALGRKTTRVEGSDVTNWTYFDSNSTSESVFKGLLREVSVNGTQEKTQYSYDTQTRRLISVTECINNHYYSPTIYTYNVNGKISSVRYPTLYLINKSYTSTGHLLQITDANDDTLWTTLGKNAQGQVTAFMVGAGANRLDGVCDYYDETHFLRDQLITNQNDAIIHHFHYNYDNFGNLARRSTQKHGEIQESFDYDDLNRLTQSTVTYQDLTYSSNIIYDINDYGSIISKTAAFAGAPSVTNAQYGIGGRPHAVSEAVVNDNAFPTNKLETSYTSFDKLSTVTRYDDNGVAEKSLTYTYGYDHQRICMIETSIDSRNSSKVYVGNCEFRVDPDRIRTFTYLSGPLGVFAVCEQIEALHLEEQKSNGDDVAILHYLFTDHLGSITTIANAKGVIEQELSYDAWGNLRSPYTWSSAFQGTPMLDRGFTGHEHLYNYGLINMNGRMYDPVMSSFLSPDIFIQNPNSSQCFNRYAYCLNNPLRYVDPSGEFLTWSINQHGFSIGVNFSPICLPIGVGVNISWANGGSVGAYGEIAWRVGGSGLGAGGGLQHSFDISFVSGYSTTTSVFGFVSYGTFSVGGSYGKNWTTNTDVWSVNLGAGLYYNSNLNAYYGGGLSLGYGSQGWSFGANGYYNRMQKPRIIASQTVSANPNNVPSVHQEEGTGDCVKKVLKWFEDARGGKFTENEIQSCLILFSMEDYRAERCSLDDVGKVKDLSSLSCYGNMVGMTEFGFLNSKNTTYNKLCVQLFDVIEKGGMVMVNCNGEMGHAVGVESITYVTGTNMWGRTYSNYSFIVMDPAPLYIGGGYRSMSSNDIWNARNVGWISKP